MNRTKITILFTILVAAPLAAVYLIRSGFYPAAIANGTIISGRSFESTVAQVKRAESASVSLPVLRRAVLDRMIELAILSSASVAKADTEGAASAALAAQARAKARVLVFLPDLTWNGREVVAR